MKKALFCLLACIFMSGAAQAQERRDDVKVVLIPIREAILACRVDGVITKLNVRFGDRFKLDDIIALVDDTRYKVEVKRIDSLIKEAEAQEKFAKQTLIDQQEMFASEMASEMELRKAELDAATSAARLLALMANRDEARLQVEYCTLRAPFPGRVEEIQTREFENVRAAQPLLRVIDDHQLLAVMNIPVASLPKAQLGKKLKLVLGPELIEREGIVSEVSPRADHRSDTIEIRALVENADGKLTAGMTGVLDNAQSK